MLALVGFIISTLIASAVLHIAVKAVAGEQTRDATFGTAVATNVLWSISFAVCGFLPLIGWLLSLVLAFVILMKMYGIGFFLSLVVLFILMVVWLALVFVFSLVAGVSMLGLIGLAAVFG